MIGVVTDSNSQIPPDLAVRLGIEVVPLTVTVDGQAYQEGVDLTADDFYARFEAGGTPRVSTAQPSPGAFAAAYERLARAGAAAIVSVHIGSAISGTVNSARLAAAGAPVPVRVVDTGTASFAVAFCAWEAAEAASGAGATVEEVEEVAAAAERISRAVRNVFVVRALDLARAGGRLAAGTEDAPAIPVLTLTEGAMRPVGHANDLDQAARIMADHVLATGNSLRVGVGLADAGTLPLVEAVEGLLRDAPEVRELIRYRIGPSVGAHTGPGTVGTMFYPSPR